MAGLGPMNLCAAIIDRISTAAIRWVRWQLRRDKRPGSWYHSYLANITCVIYDELNNRSWARGIPDKQLYDVAQTSAARFMDQWVDEVVPPLPRINKWLDLDR